MDNFFQKKVECRGTALYGFKLPVEKEVFRKNITMKKCAVTLILFGIYLSSFAQTNTFPATGNVGIGTASPTEKFYISEEGLLRPTYESVTTTSGNVLINPKVNSRSREGRNSVGSNGMGLLLEFIP